MDNFIKKEEIKEGIREYTASLKKQFAGISMYGDFFRSVKNRMGIGSPERNAAGTYERGMAIVPECIRANEHEIPVKQFNIAVLRSLFKFERAEGRIQVTNKRVIFRAAGRSVGGRTTLQHEFAVDEIAGIEAKTNYKFSFLYLVFAALIIAFAFFVMYRPPAVSWLLSPKQSQSSRIASIMLPKHVQQAYADENAAINQRRQADEAVFEANENVKSAKEAEEEAAEIAKIGILKTRRVVVGRDWWGDPVYRTERYRDLSPEGLQEAKELLDAAVAEREKAEAAMQAAVARLRVAQENEAEAIRKRIDTVNTWKALMTLLGVLIGFGGLLPFFMLYKKFGLKLFILVVSNFGFSLAFAASQNEMVNWFAGLSVIALLVCVFIFCFRPNVVISIKNKMGTGEGPVDIRCDEKLNRSMEALSFVVLIAPFVIFGGLQVLSTFSRFSDDLFGSLFQGVVPVILAVILIVTVSRLLQKNNESANLSSGFAEVFPTEETEGAIREIGAIIGDIQKLGDLGIDKWVKK